MQSPNKDTKDSRPLFRSSPVAVRMTSAQVDTTDIPILVERCGEPETDGMLQYLTGPGRIIPVIAEGSNSSELHDRYSEVEARDVPVIIERCDDQETEEMMQYLTSPSLIIPVINESSDSSELQDKYSEDEIRNIPIIVEDSEKPAKANYAAQSESMDQYSKAAIFELNDVKFVVAGPLKEECFSLGHLSIYREPHGLIISWIPNNLRTQSPSEDTLDWEKISPGDVGFKVAFSDEEDGKVIMPRKDIRPINFELSDLKSFRKEEKMLAEFVKSSEVIATFYLRDGSAIHSLHFKHESEFMKFVVAIETFVPLRRSLRDDSLYIIEEADEKTKDKVEKTFSQLELFDDDTHLVTKMIKHPYETAMDGFSKVTSYLMGTWYPNSEQTLKLETASKSAEICHTREKEEDFDSRLRIPQVDIDPQEEPGYELITCIQMPSREKVLRESPVCKEEWDSYFDRQGKIKLVTSLKNRIFRGGLDHSIRSEAWPILLGYQRYKSTSQKRRDTSTNYRKYYYSMKNQWMSFTKEQESRFAAFRERRNLIDKDVSRTDRNHPYYKGEKNDRLKMLNDILMTYVMFNFDLGYVQGMSDLLSPILVVMRNESEAFWCFVSCMNKIGTNFEMEQKEIKAQMKNLHILLHFIDPDFCTYLDSHDSGNMYFAFRWLLILFKRDFKFDDVMRLWEVLWTELPCKNFHLLVCLAILDEAKTMIVENDYGLSEILKHTNDMAYNINLDDTLSKAESIFNQIANCNRLSDVVQNILQIHEVIQDEEDTESEPDVCATMNESIPLVAIDSDDDIEQISD